MLHFLSNTFSVDDNIIDSLIEKYCMNCVLCKGARVLEHPKKGWQKCKCLEEYNKEYVLYAANIPKEFHFLTKADFTADWQKKNKDFFNRSIQYSTQLPKAFEKGFGLYLGGEHYAGKTFIAALLLKRAVQQGYTGYFILLRDLISIAMNALRSPEVQEDVDHLMTDIDFLVLDDVDKVTAVKDQELVSTVTLALLKKRTYSGKPTIVTANCRKSELHLLIGDNLSKTLTTNLSELYYKGDANSGKVKALEDEFFKDV